MATIPIGDLLRLNAARKPVGSPALVYPQETLTWDELDQRSNRRARLYQSLGVGQDDLVTIALENSPAFHEAAFAVWKLGATPNIVSSRLPTQEFNTILDLARPRLVVGGAADSDGGGSWPRAPDDRVLEAFDAGPVASRVAASWRALTSGGSTGRPKIIVDHAPSALDPEGQGAHSIVQLPRDAVVLNPGPLYHAAPFLFTSTALFLGSTVVGMVRFDAEETLRLIAEHKVGWVCLVPTMMKRILSLPAERRLAYDLSSLKLMWHMAAPCSAELKRAWIDWLGPDRVWELYGGSESIGGTTIGGRAWLEKPGSVGKVVGATDVKVVREDGSDCQPGDVGEIYFRSPRGVEASHYIGAEFRRLDGGWVSLGDLGSMDPDGYIFLADRRTDLILRGGANIYPAEVEAALEGHPGVEGAVVVGLPCDDLGQRVHAIIQPAADGHAPTPEDLDAFVRTRLAHYKRPESYEFVAEPLRDDAGKVRRSALRADLKTRQQGRIRLSDRAATRRAFSDPASSAPALSAPNNAE